MSNCPACFTVAATTPPSRRVVMLDNLAANAASDPRVQSVARYLYDQLAARLGRGPTAAETAQWLMDALHLLCDYAPDPPGEEVFQSVEWTLSGACSPDISPITDRPKGCGDCEDLASCFVALCMCLGLRARVRWWDQPGQALNHVSAQVAIDGTWTDAETTIPGARLGESPYAALSRVGPSFRTRIFGLNEAAGGLFRPAGSPGDAAEVRVTGLVAPGATWAAWSFMVDGGSSAPRWYGSTPGVNPDAALFVMPSGRHTITVFHPFPASNPPKTWVVEVPDGGLTIPYATPSTPGTGAVARADVRITGLVAPGAAQAAWSFSVDGRPAAPRWYGSTPGVNPDAASFTVAPGRHSFTVAHPNASAHPPKTWVVTVPEGGLTIPYASAPSNGLSSIRLLGVPARARGYLDGSDVPVGARQEGGQWVVDVTSGRHSIRVVEEGGAARVWAGDVPEDGSVSVSYAEMRPAFAPVDITVTTVPGVPPPAPTRKTAAPPRKEAPPQAGPFIDFGAAPPRKEAPPQAGPFIDFGAAPPRKDEPAPAAATGRVVVRGAPLGIQPARVVIPGGAPGDPAQSQPLTLQPGGYLAVTWPIGLARLHLGGHDIGVTVMRDTDSVYDYAADALTFRPLVTDARVAPNPEGTGGPGGPGVFPGNAKPAVTPAPDTVPVELWAAPQESDREVVLVSRDGNRHALVPESSITRQDSSASIPPTDVWRGNVRPGDYTVRAVSENGRVREAPVRVAASGDGPVQVLMGSLVWTVSDQGTVVVRGLPADGDSPSLSTILRGYSGYSVEASGGGRTSLFRGIGEGAAAAYLAPGSYTITVIHETAAGRERPTATPIRVAHADVRAGVVTEVAYDSMAPLAADSSADARFRLGSYGRVVVSGVPNGWAVMLDGSHPSEEAGARVVFDRVQPGERPLTLHQGLLRKTITVPVVVSAGQENSLNLAYETARAEAFGVHPDGVTGMTEDGRRIGYFSDLTTAANAEGRPFLSRDEERRAVREFDRVGKIDANGVAPYALFVRGHGMVAMPATQAQIDALIRRWGQLRYPMRDGYYFYELSL